jgi:uncharacterized protein
MNQAFKISVRVTDDKLAAFLSIQGDEKNYPDYQRILNELHNQGIRHGIDEGKIRQLAAAKKPVQELLIARGQSLSRGEDAQLIWYIDLNSNSGGTAFKTLKKQKQVSEGQELVAKLPATDGKPEIKVTGESRYAPGNDIALPRGKNTMVSEDGLTLYSQIDGYLVAENNLLSVDNVYRIHGNIDLNTGNIKYNGTVIIDGDVRSSYRVYATDSIYIDGTVEAANIYSQNGDVVIRRGVLGRGRANILAGGQINAGFIQDATVGAKKDVIVERYVINSGISSGGRVVLKKNEGLIRGGKIHADEGVEAIEIGSDQSRDTEIIVSSNDYYKMDSRKWEIKKAEETLMNHVNTIKRRVEFLRLLEQRLKRLSPEKQNELNEASDELNSKMSQLEALRMQEQLIDSERNREETSKTVIVRGILHKGLKIGIGNKEVFVDKNMFNVRYFRRGDQIIFEENDKKQDS